MHINEIFLLVDYKKNLIKQYVQAENEFRNIKFYFIQSKSDIGLADVLAQTQKKIKGPFVMILGDDFTISPNIANFPYIVLPKNGIALEAVAKENDKKTLNQTCEIYLDKNGQISKAVEKPQNPKSKYRGTGLYFFHPQVFEYIKKTPLSSKTGKREITDTINVIAKEGKAFAWKVLGVNININTQEDLTQATKLLFSKKKCPK